MKNFYARRLLRHVSLRSTFLAMTMLSLLFFMASAAFADIPHLINYQGKLTDKDNKPIEGTQSVTFRIYNAESEGKLLWEETQSVSVSKGIFSVMLGGVTRMDLSFSEPYWLELKVNNETMTTRQRIASVGYAIRAETAQNSDAVSNIGASVTPEANKLLPLDSNAKLPVSVLPFKVYDSGWFAITQNSTYTRSHNLGTTKLAIFVYGATDGNGANMTLAQDIYFNVSVEEGMEINNITPTQFTLITGWGSSIGQGGYHLTGDTRGDRIPFTHARIIAMALGD